MHSNSVASEKMEKPIKRQTELVPAFLCNDKNASVALIVLALLLFLPGFFTVPPLDRDEPRFAQASKQMLESGDYVDIRFQEEPRHKKPVGIYWLQSGFAKLTGLDAGSPIWVYRLPSLIGAILAILATFWCARAFTGPPEALIVACFVGATIILGVEARLAKTDAFLLATVVFAQGALVRIWQRDKVKRPVGLALIFWAAFAAGILIKGPVGPMVLALTIGALCIFTRKVGWVARLMPVSGLLLSVVLVMPWFVAITIATDGAFFEEAVFKDLLGKVGQGQESHGAPPLTHLAAMIGTFWPLSAFAILAAPIAFRRRREPAFLFLLAWALPSWVVFELVATKLPHYTMPIMPAIALLVVLAFSGSFKSWRFGRAIAAVLMLLVPLGLLVVSIGAPLYFDDPVSFIAVSLCLIGAVFAFISAKRLYLALEPLKAFVPAIIAVLFCYGGIWGGAFPALSTIWISPRLAAAIDENSACVNPAIKSAGFHEPSFVFLTRTDTSFDNPGRIAEWLSMPGCRIAVVDAKQLHDFTAFFDEKGMKPAEIALVQGLNINGGKELALHVFQMDHGK
ncbi:MAG: glycosyltransferase family 39 protein [Stappiaceae bacterium]